MPEIMQFRGRPVRPDDTDDPLHDGDTLWLETDHGRSIHMPAPIRLRNVHAPELEPLQLGGPETRDYLRTWITTWNTTKWPYWVDSYRTNTHHEIVTWSRYVCDIWNADRTACLNHDIQQYIHDHGYPPGN